MYCRNRARCRFGRRNGSGTIPFSFYFSCFFPTESESLPLSLLLLLIYLLKPLQPLTRSADVANRSMDLTMMELQNSRERELEDWETLFAQADRRFSWKGGKQPRGSRLWILEAVWEGDLSEDSVGNE